MLIYFLYLHNSKLFAAPHKTNSKKLLETPPKTCYNPNNKKQKIGDEKH